MDFEGVCSDYEMLLRNQIYLKWRKSFHSEL